MYSSSSTPSSTIAIRHSSGCETLISISCFMMSLSCPARSASTHRVAGREPAPVGSGGDAHGCNSTAVRVRQDALLFQIGQPQRRQHVARAGAAARGRRAAASQHAVLAATARPATRRRSTGGPRSGAGRRPGRRRPADVAMRSASRGSALRRERAISIGRRCGPGPSCSPAGRTSTDANAQSRQGVRRQPRAQLVGGTAVRPVPVPSLRRVPRCRRPGPRESSSAVWDETLRSCPAAARRGGTAAPGTAPGPGARSAAGLPACENEYVLVVEPSVRTSPPLPLAAENRKVVELSQLDCSCRSCLGVHGRARSGQRRLADARSRLRARNSGTRFFSSSFEDSS